MRYGGRFEGMIEEEGFFVKKMESRVTNEITFYSETSPVALVTGWCLSKIVSTRAANVPFETLHNPFSALKIRANPLKTVTCLA